MTEKIPCTINVSCKDTTLEAAFTGDWVLDADIPPVQAVYAQLDAAANIKRLVFSTASLGRWDSLLMSELIRLINHSASHSIQVDTTTLPAGIQGLLSLVYAVPEQLDTRRASMQSHWLAVLGAIGLDFYKDFQSLIVFIGELAESVFASLGGKAHFRANVFWLNMRNAGPAALPIITLISVLIGMILAFVGAVQLTLFGAEIYIADMVGLPTPLSPL